MRQYSINKEMLIIALHFRCKHLYVALPFFVFIIYQEKDLNGDWQQFQPISTKQTTNKTDCHDIAEILL
jgi:hypothetical protein